jgi:predicted sulfurtransferase
MTEDKYRPFNEDELLKQIGIQNVFAISGGLFRYGTPMTARQLAQ